MKPTDLVAALTRIWNRANRTERTLFLKSVGAGTPLSKPMTTVVDVDGYLLKPARIKIERILHDRKIKNGQIMKEIGFSALDASLGAAMRDLKPSTIQPDLAIALTDWVNKH